MSGKTLEQLRERYNELKLGYAAETLSPAENSECEQIAVELQELHQLTSDRAEIRLDKQYPRGTMPHPDPSIFQDFN